MIFTKFYNILIFYVILNKYLIQFLNKLIRYPYSKGGGLIYIINDNYYLKLYKNINVE